MFLFKGLWEEFIAIPLIDYPKHTVNWSPWWDMKKNKTWVFDINIFGIFILSSSLGIITLLSWYYHTIIILGIVMILLWTKIQTATKKFFSKNLSWKLFYTYLQLLLVCSMSICNKTAGWTNHNNPALYTPINQGGYHCSKPLLLRTQLFRKYKIYSPIYYF